MHHHSDNHDQPRHVNDYIADIANAAHRGQVTNWGHEGRSGTFGEIGFIVQPGGPMWRSMSPRSTAELWFEGRHGTPRRSIGAFDARFTSPKGRLIARIVELGKAAMAAEFEQKVKAAAQGTGCVCGGACPCKSTEAESEGSGVA